MASDSSTLFSGDHHLPGAITPEQIRDLAMPPFAVLWVSSESVRRWEAWRDAAARCCLCCGSPMVGPWGVVRADRSLLPGETPVCSPCAAAAR